MNIKKVLVMVGGVAAVIVCIANLAPFLKNNSVASVADAGVNVYHVAKNGSAQGNGSINAPFATIQQAADVAGPGDTVMIHAGTYRETVTVHNSGSSNESPITFEPYNNDSVTVDGADAIKNWTPTSNPHIWSAPMSTNLGDGNNQVFVDNQMMNDARWPNSSLDVSHPTFATVDHVAISNDQSVVTVYDAALTQSNGYWVGSTVHIGGGANWAIWGNKITASGPGWITFPNFVSYYHGSDYETAYFPKAGNRYFIVGNASSLDTGGEWYRNGSGQLMLWTPNGDSPANHYVEAKHRQYAFDLGGASFIQIKGINIFASTINTSENSKNIVIDHMVAKYVSHTAIPKLGLEAPSTIDGFATGIVIAGPNNVLENSVIAYSSGNGVFVTGHNAHVINNLIHDTDYSGTETAGIRMEPTQYMNIEYNTLYNTGRSGILYRRYKNMNSLPMVRVSITNNIVHDFGLQTYDVGAYYDANIDGKGSEIAYNTFYNGSQGGYGSVGVYPDNNSSNFIIHDNVVYNVSSGIRLNLSSFNEIVVSNTLSSYAGGDALDGSQADWKGSIIEGNDFKNKIGYFGFGPSPLTVSNNKFEAGGTVTKDRGNTPPPPFASLFTNYPANGEYGSKTLYNGANSSKMPSESSLVITPGDAAGSSTPTPVTPTPTTPEDSNGGPQSNGSILPDGSWHMTFNDEFNGTTLDTSKWDTNYVNNPCRNADVSSQVFKPTDVTLSNGLAHLTARKEPNTCGGTQFAYTSGLIQNHKSFSQKYGYFEMRAKIPGPSQGFGIGFWTLNSAGGWPPEIDILEAHSGQPTKLWFTLHYLQDQTHKSTGTNWIGPDLSAGYHTFGMDWEPNKMTWYVDGVARRTLTNPAIIPNMPEYIIANLNVNTLLPGWSVPPNDATAFPSSLDIDYIRAYQKSSGSGTPTPPPPTPPTPVTPTPVTPTPTSPNPNPSGTPFATTNISAFRYTQRSGSIAPVNTTESLGFIHDGDWLKYTIDFGNGVDTFNPRLSTVYSGGTLEVHTDSVTGPLAGKLNITNTGNWSNYGAQTTSVTGLTGVKVIYLVFHGTANNGNGVANIKDFVFSKTTGSQVFAATSNISALHYADKHGAIAPVNATESMGYINNGDWLKFKLNFGTGVDTLKARLATIFTGGSMEIHTDSPTGPLAGKINIANTGDWGTYTTQTTSISGVTGIHDTYFVFHGTANRGIGIGNLKDFIFSNAHDTSSGNSLVLTADPMNVVTGNIITFTMTLPTSLGKVDHWVFDVKCTGSGYAVAGLDNICSNPKRYDAQDSNPNTLDIRVLMTMSANDQVARAMTGEVAAYSSSNAVLGSASLKTILSLVSLSNSPVVPPETNGSISVDDSVMGTGLNQFNYQGTGWKHCVNGVGCGAQSDELYNKSNSWTFTPYDVLRFRFNGSKVTLYGVKDSIHGKALVLVDGGPATTIDFYNGTRVGDVPLWTSPALGSGEHQLTLVNLGTKNPNSNGATVAVDRIQIQPPAHVSFIQSIHDGLTDFYYSLGSMTASVLNAFGMGN